MRLQGRKIKWKKDWKNYLVMKTYLLAQRPNWVIPKKNIYCSVWESNYYDDQIPYKTVEHVVWKIRKKMGHDIIETLINVGYRLKKM